MDKEKMTNQELTEQRKAGEPLTGLPIYTPGASGFGLRDSKGNAVGDTWYSIETPVPDINDPNARIGDYVLQKGTPVVVPNSPTDLNLKYQIVSGGTEYDTGSFDIWDAIKSAGSTGIATAGVVPTGLVGKAIAGAVGATAGLIGGRISAMEKAVEDWKNQEVEVSSGVEFYRDDNGALKYKVSPQKLAEGGARSGSAVKEAQERQTDVKLGDDGRLKITVSPIFASTARFKEIMDYVSENFAGLNKDTENLDQILGNIKDSLDSEARDFLANSQLYADYAAKYDADPLYVTAAYTDEIIGYTDPENMGDLDIVVLNDNNEIKTENAKKFFDSVLKMTPDQRGALIGKLTQIASTAEGYENYNENQRAIAYGELQALWAASENKRGYESDYAGMLNSGPIESFLNSFSPFRINAGDAIDAMSGGTANLSDQRWLKQNELASTVGVLGGTYVTVKGFQKLFGTGGDPGIIGNALKQLPGSSKLFEASLEGKAGTAATLNEIIGKLSTKELAKAGEASFLFNSLKVGLYDAAIEGVRSGVSGTDFFKEFGEDFAQDMIINAVMQYYDTIRLTARVDSGKKFLYEDPKTGETKTLDTYQPQVYEAGAGEVREKTFTTIGQSGKPEEFTITGTGASVYEPVGAYNVQRTPAGDVVGAFDVKGTSGLIVNDKVFTMSSDGVVEPLLLETGDVGIDEFPVLSTGVVSLGDAKMAKADTIEKALELANLPKDTRVFEVPSRAANAAIIAGKLAKIDTSKIGSAVNQTMFNRNAMLDAVNLMALSKSGDLTAYQKRTESVASLQQNAARNSNEIANGIYYKPATQAFANYDKAIGEANLTHRLGKVDANYLNAIGELARAKLLNDTRVEGDTTDYLASALEVYGDALTAVSPERATQLDKIQEARIARGKAIVKSAKKSGKIDVKKLEKITDSDVQEIGWVPIWGKKTNYNGLLDRFYGISQERDPYRGWLRNNEWVPLDELANPLQADADFLSLVTNNMGLNDRDQATVEALQEADLLVDNTPSEATVRKRKMDSIKNKDELKNKLDSMIAERKAEIKEKALTPAQYKERMDNLYKEHNIDEAINRAIDRPKKITAKNWDKTWKTMTPEMRRALRNELEKTSMWDVIDSTNPANVPTEPQFKQPYRPTYENYRNGLQTDPSMAKRLAEVFKNERATELISAVHGLLADANEYLKDFGYSADITTYMNTATIPNIQKAINMGSKEGVSAVIAQSVIETSPYVDPVGLEKDELDKIAEEWHDWAVNHIKAGRATTKDLKKFVDDNNLKLSDDKRPLPNKIKHALWEKVQNGERLPKIEGLNTNKISKDTPKEDFYKMLDETPLFQGAIRDKNELVDLIAADINTTTTDAYTMGVSRAAVGMGGKYPVTFYRNGRPYTRLMVYDTKQHKRIAESILALQSDKQLVRQPGWFRRLARTVSNDFRNLTTGWDPSRVPLNRMRDLTRGNVASAGINFWNPKRVIEQELNATNFTEEQKKTFEQALDRTVKLAQGARYNEAYRTPRKAATDITKRYLENSDANKLRIFRFNLRSDKRSILEWPMNFFENLTRKNLTESAAAATLAEGRVQGKNFDQILDSAMAAAEFAGKEYTANFGRKGEIIGELSQYTAYLSSAFAGFDSLKKAFVVDPVGVSSSFAMFLILYSILLADTLADENSRRNYYRLSDYDRSNSIVISLDNNSLITIPMDQELAGLIYPYRRIMETMNNVDPVTFFELAWGLFTEPIPFDLSGFSEGDAFNLKRGLEKLRSQMTPNLVEGVFETITGYDPYYGSDNSVSAETLKDYGIYDPQPGDFTTQSKNSLWLRNISNATGIPQWQLQTALSNYGGNVGQYVLYTLDKLSGATEDERGGKSFADTLFNSLVGSDKETAENEFYNGINQLKQEKNKLLQAIYDLNEKSKTLSGDELYKVQAQIQEKKDAFATKVSDYVNQYLNVYEITGGLSKSQAMQIYYLFRLDDDNTIYPSGSVEEYYHNQVLNQFKNQATNMSASILDKYYNNRLGNIYQDTDGTWKQYLTRGTQALKNSIYGEALQHKVNLLNILEGKDGTYKNLRTQVRDQRNSAYDTEDWDKRNELAYLQDKAIVDAIAPYIEKYGAENVLGNNEVLDYLSDWFIVPDEFKTTKKGYRASLANDASTQEAFVRPFIKFIFGLDTGYSSYSDTKISNPGLEGIRE